MFQLFATVIRWIQNLLNFIVPSDVANKPGESSDTSILVVHKLPRKAGTATNEAAPRLDRFFISFLADRWDWLRRHIWLVGSCVIIISVIFYGEAQPTPWWSSLFQQVNLWWTQLWQDHPLGISLIGIALLLFLFGLDWLRQLDNWLLRLWQWAKGHPQISTTIGVILLVIIFYIISNANTWAFTSVEVWSEQELGLKSEEIAVQFRGNLNAIGTTSVEVLTLSAPSPPAAVTKAKSTLRPLSLEDCPQIMIGPKSFVALGGRSPISLPRLSRAQADNGTAGQISLGTTLGKFDLPLSGLVRLIFSVTAPNYRELSAQIVPASRTSEAGAIRLIVTALDGSRWTVEGSRDNLPQLINFLAQRIALDWKAERTGQATDQVESADLALTLGNQAFAAGDYKAALAYYRLAETFRPDSASIEVMLGLTQLQMSKTATTDADAQIWRDKTARAFNQATALDPNNADLFPYLACFYQQLGQAEPARQKIEAFNATLGPDSPDAKQERITELDKKPAQGPGRRLSVFQHETGFDLYYISDDSARFTLNLPYEGLFAQTGLTFEAVTAGEAPRQMFAVTNGAYYLTSDGLVNFFRAGRPPQIIPVIDSNSLQFSTSPTGKFALNAERNEDPTLTTNNTGGIRQLFAEGELLFLLDRFGRILRLRVVETGTGGLDVSLEAVAQADARQIFLDANALYLLKEDGTIWRISDPRTGDLQAARQLITDTDNHEITASNGVIYILRANGNIWRYLDGEGKEGDLIKRIDGGVETSQIFIAPDGLFVLKNNGVVWLIRNPQNPAPSDIQQLTLPAANRVAINVTGSNLIALERGETGGPVIKIYQKPAQGNAANIAQQVVQAEAPAGPLPTLIPTSTPTPLPPPMPTETPVPLPTAADTPTPLPADIITPTTEITTTLVVSQTRPADGMVEVLVTNSQVPTDSFWLDRTEVTNKQYLECVTAGACTENATGYADLFYLDDHPVVGVNWQQAQKYCAWAGGSLPTVSQWRAAVSPDGRIYPWGDAGPSCQVAVINDACDAEEPGTRPVGSKPAGASPFGALDLVGSVWEWTATVGDKNDARLTLGGAWSNPDGTPQGGFDAFNPANAVSQGEGLQANNLGFRCTQAHTPASAQ